MPGFLNIPINHAPHTGLFFRLCVCFWSLFLPLTGAACAEGSAPGRLFEALSGKNPNDYPLFKDHGLNVGGWATVGFTYNPASPSDRNNTPVSMNFRSNEWNLHQLDLFIEKPMDAETKGWAIGGRFDFMFGTDTPYTQARGDWDSRLIGENVFRFYKIALPQAYIDIRTPLGSGLTARIGHFYSILGYESVPSPPNFFYSHSYSMKSSPFTHTGVLLSYPLTGDFTFYSGAVTGPDNFDDQFGAWSFLGGFNWKLNEQGANFAVSALSGDVSETVNDNLTYLSAVLQIPITENLRYVLQHDNGWQAHVTDNGGLAGWYSIVQYLTWQFEEKLGVGGRAEWFRDQNGTRYGIPDTGYYEFTLGMNWKPFKWLAVRPEVRYDWADGPGKVYDNGKENSQWLLGTDFVVLF